MRRMLLLTAIVAVLIAASAAFAQATFPETIPLPNGWQPEGIAIGRGTTFYVGSIPTGAIFRGDLRTGQGAPFIPAASGRAAVGLDFDRGKLFVAGGPTGKGFVYDARTGALIRELELASGTSTFVNDVVVTKRAAWFTDSSNAVLYKLPLSKNGQPAASAQTVNLSGDFELMTGFNLNGIDATPNGKTLVVVQSNLGKLFTVTTSGVTTEIDLGGATVMNGDGILLQGRTLYVVRNQNNQIAVVQLGRNFASGRITRTITDPDFDVPTTIGRFGKWLYAVNARFGTPPTPTTEYSVVQVPR